LSADLMEPSWLSILVLLLWERFAMRGTVRTGFGWHLVSHSGGAWNKFLTQHWMQYILLRTFQNGFHHHQFTLRLDATFQRSPSVYAPRSLSACPSWRNHFIRWSVEILVSLNMSNPLWLFDTWVLTIPSLTFNALFTAQDTTRTYIPNDDFMIISFDLDSGWLPDVFRLLDFIRGACLRWIKAIRTTDTTAPGMVTRVGEGPTIPIQIRGWPKTRAGT
jgi:hypothetical protein